MRRLAKVLPEWSEAKETLETSREVYARAIALEPGKVSYYVARGNVGMQLVDPKVLDDFEKALALDADNVRLRLRVSRFYHESSFGVRNWRKALDSAEDALALAPDNPALCANIGETTSSSFITVEGEEEKDVRRNGKQWSTGPGSQRKTSTVSVHSRLQAARSRGGDRCTDRGKTVTAAPISSSLSTKIRSGFLAEKPTYFLLSQTTSGTRSQGFRNEHTLLGGC
jgi:hypothetical protein